MIIRRLLTPIIERITSALPDIKYVDVDWGQLDFFNDHPPVQWPCAIIEFVGASWSNATKGAQLGLVTLRVRLADLRLIPSSGKVSQSRREEALGLYALAEELHRTLHGWQPNTPGSREASRLIRSATDVVKREDGLRIVELTYTCEVISDATPAAASTMQLAPAVQPQLGNPPA